MPTTAVNTFNASKLVPFINPQNAMVKEIKIGASKTLAAGTIMAEVTTTPGVYDAYASGGAGGLGTPIGLLVNDVTTDSSGNITSINGMPVNVFPDINVPMYYKGVFNCADVKGDTVAHMISSGLGRLLEGDSLTGLVDIN